MRKLFILLALPLLLAACEKYERRSYVNGNAECCGVKDPMHNLPWLRDLGDEAQNKVDSGESLFERSYLLFANDTTGENMIVEVDRHDVFTPQQSSVTLVRIYHCDGTQAVNGGDYSLDEILDEIQTKASLVSPYPCDSCRRFFESHTFVDTLACHSYILR